MCVDERPALAVVVAAVQAGPARAGLDERPDPPGTGPRDGHAVLAEQAPAFAAGQAAAAGQFLPGVAAVERPPQSAARAAAVQVPEAASRVPAGGVDDARVQRVERQVHGAAVGVAVEHLLPVRAAIARAVDATLLVRAEGVAERCHEDEVGVGRVHADATDVPRVPQADVLPGAAGVARAVHAVAPRDVDADRRLARAGVDDVGVRRRHCQRADGGAAEVAVGDVAPHLPAVAGLPDPARAAAEVEGHRVLRVAGHGDDTTAARRADAAPLQPAEEQAVDVRGAAGHRASPRVVARFWPRAASGLSRLTRAARAPVLAATPSAPRPQAPCTR